MLSRNKSLRYIGIPVELALLMLAGGFWVSMPVSRAGDATDAYDADSHTGIWVPPDGSSVDITRPPWDDSRNRPQEERWAVSVNPTQPDRAPTDSGLAQMTTIEKLRKDGIGFLTAAALEERMKYSWHGIVVDVGARSAYLHAHIQGAINIPENQISTLAPIVLPDLRAPIVTYCGSAQCTASMNAAKQLKALGYAEVYDFWGGLKEWVAMGLPTQGSEVAGK